MKPMITSHARTLALSCLALGFASPIHAAITVVNTASVSSTVVTDQTASASLNYNLASGGNILVVGLYTDFAPATNSITFDAGAGTGTFTSDRGRMSYFQTAESATSVTIAATSNANSLGFVVWELSGVDLSKGVVSAGGSNTINTTELNTFIVGFGFINGNTAANLDPTGAVYTSTDIAPFQIANNASTGAIGGASGLAGAAGSYDISWAGDGNGSPMAYGFVAVPEPSGALLGLLGGMAFFLRRRR